MTVRAYRRRPFLTPHKNTAFDALLAQLQLGWGDSGEDVALLGNFQCKDSEIDALILKRGSISVLNFKDYGGKVTFSEARQWYADGTEMEGRNPYLQIREKKSVLLNFLKHLELPSGRIPGYGHISGIVIFNSQISFDESQLPRNISPWLHVVDLGRSLERLSKITSEEINLSSADIEAIITALLGSSYRRNPTDRQAASIGATVTAPSIPTYRLKRRLPKLTGRHAEKLASIRGEIEKERVRWQVQEEEEREAVRKEEEQHRRVQAQRDALLQEVRGRLQSDFLGIDSFFQESCASLIPPKTYEREKINFVKSWVAKNTPSSANSEQHMLDDEQATAIAAVHGHIQVTARAGSGKTKTLVNRALFLLKHCGAAASEILLLAFNRKAALEMRRRLLALLHEDAESAFDDTKRRLGDAGRKKGIDRGEVEEKAVDAVAQQLNIALPHVMTFHALAYAIVHPKESLLYDDPEGETEELRPGLSQVVRKVINEHLQKDVFNNQIRELMLAHFRSRWDRLIKGLFPDREEFLQYHRSLPQESLGGEYVKSDGEKVIANFLFEHDIDYEYGRDHWWNGINYHPTFMIFLTSKNGIVVECFGRKGERRTYDEMADKKRRYWNDKQGWALIELVSDSLSANRVESFLAPLKEHLEGQGIPCVRLSEDEIWHRVRNRGALERFRTAMVSFIGRCRQQSLSPRELRERVDSYSPLLDVERMFHDLAGRLYVSYLERLSETGEEDFNGLMQRAAEVINDGKTLFKRKSGSGDLRQLRYVCIDEFQDFSDLFYRLLSAIRKQNSEIELFCVGDDWQAINGFAGSDLRFFKDFESYIGKSQRLNISTNYRSSKAIVSVGNALMPRRDNPAKARKNSRGQVFVAALNEFEPSLIEKEYHPRDKITPAVLRLVNKALTDDLDVVMLCRTNNLPWPVYYGDQDQDVEQDLTRFLALIRSFFSKGLKERISISTVHKYKGLEKQMVIVLDAIDDCYPLIHPDWIFSRILGDSFDKIRDEEQRLLYVALTRAVERLVIITDESNKSPFLEELEKRQPLSTLDWTDFPPVQYSTPRLVVKVGNQKHRGSSPTFAIKDRLKAAGYQWRTSWRGWEKSFPAEGFSLEILKTEAWVGQADGIEVQISDDAETLVARYSVDEGKWSTDVDDIMDD